MGTLVSYGRDDAVATITMDDGKVNVLSPAMLEALHGALDAAEADGAVVVLTGRPGVLSAGFDLPTLQGGGEAARGMVRGGFELAARLLGFPTPVVIACPGHAIAMGAFLLLSGDERIGAAGPAKIVANEVAIGLTLPRTALEIARQRLGPEHLTRAVLLSEVCTPEQAVEVGFLDRVVPAAELADAAARAARAHATLDLAAHAGSKRRMREETLGNLRALLKLDDADFASMGVPRG